MPSIACMRHLIPLCALLGTLSLPLAAEAVNPPPAPGPTAGGAELSKDDRRAMMKEYMEIDAQLRPIREKVAQNPELLKMKTAVEQAQKDLRAKEDELMSDDPAFADLKVKRDQLQEKMMSAGLNPNRPMRPNKDGGKPPGAPGAPPEAPAPAPAPKL